jgi:tetratricopeptide (TPR) repeat protein
LVNELQSRLEESFAERQELTDKIAALTSELDDIKTSNAAAAASASGSSDDRNWANLRNALKDTRRVNRELRQAVAQQKPSFMNMLVKKLEGLNGDSVDSISTDIALMLDRRTFPYTLKNSAIGIMLYAIENPSMANICVLLCKKLIGRIAPSEHDEKIQDAQGNILVGSALFRRALVLFCQIKFEQFLEDKEEFRKAHELDNNAKDPASILLAKALNRLDREKYILGLAQLLGELGKQFMLTERIMHECIKSLIKDPKNHCLRFLYILLLTVGQHLDTPRARGYMDIYFSRINLILASPDLDSDLQRLLEVGPRTETIILVCLG